MLGIQMKKVALADGSDGITLRDVVVHMQHMEVRLSGKIDNLDKRLSSRMDTLEIHMDLLEERLTARMDALEEDLTATIKDTIAIRRHVGMPLPEEE